MLSLMFLLIILTIAVTGCMKEKEVCNYDAVCTADETDNCADCKNVMGRDVGEPTNQEVQVPLGAKDVLS
ncbi:hypothetical protein COV13_01705 [Candidatus Woesearchaeota archaeon CG10_big_fil_rev_8_21_14_0_10_32_9]|nr:MAG: hypothetical protein COV13_01705 [Candidatus Woesearchaeota archaeon CG10_big_fil_rev_8_21_14_0_10_32_9]